MTAEAERAVVLVWKREAARVISGLTRILRDVSLAEEVAQDALVAALEHWPTSGVPENPGAWLMTTAKHRALNTLRRAKLAPASSDPDELFEHAAHVSLADVEAALEARMDVWQQWFTRPKAHMDALVALYRMSVDGVPASERRMTEGNAHLRPPFLHFNRCRRVRLEGVRIVNSPFWTVHPFLCEDVLIRNVSIRAHGHNNDGIDPEMSQRVLIEDCTFDQGDDAISVKSGRERDGWRLATPSRHIVMRRCKVLNGHQLMAIGSELAGGISEVLVEDCEVDNRASTHKVQLFNLLFVKTNERRGGFVRNIHLRRVKAHRLAGSVLDVDTDVLYQWRTLMPTLEKRLTPVEGLFVSDVTVSEAKHISRLRGEAALPVRGVSVTRVQVDKLLGEAHDHRNAVEVSV